MTATELHHFLLGGVVVACGVAGLLFMRFWRRSGDRLFLIFGVAFWTLGVNWLVLAFTRQDEARTWLYVLRLLAFVLILWGIWDKNRPGRDKRSPALRLRPGGAGRG